MIIALALLAALMAACGAAALVAGWDVVLTERGWTQVIAGATGLTGGLVLIGLTCVVAELKRLRRAITSAVMDVSEEDLPPAPVDPISPAKVTATGAAALAAVTATAAVSAEMAAPIAEPRLEPAYDEPVYYTERRSEDDEPIREPGFILQGPGGEHETPDLSLHARQDAPNHSPPTAPDEPPGDGLGPTEPMHESEPRISGPPQVIGTYASAGITYYMFSDDSIEAEMEQGRFRFETMDELRQFLETGEGGLLLAAADEDTPMST